MKWNSLYKALSWEITKGLSKAMALKDISWKPSRVISHDTLFRKHNHQKFFFIQVGANDGVTGDDLRKYILQYKWHGVLVEPVPYVFERLKNNYKGVENLEFLNCAIGIETATSKFYSISETDSNGQNLFDAYADFKIDQLSSFNKETILKHEYMHPDFKNLIVETEIPTLGINELLFKYPNQTIDLLQIDIEGFDFELLDALDLGNKAPGILIFEHQHMPESKYREILRKLKSYHYQFYKSNWDTISVRKES